MAGGSELFRVMCASVFCRPALPLLSRIQNHSKQWEAMSRHIANDVLNSKLYVTQGSLFFG